MVKNKHGRYITFPTVFEVFGKGEKEDGNWKDGYRIEYFKKIKNRIRVKDNYTSWWWLSTAADSAYFAFVGGGGGGAGGANARDADGGVSPAFCIS
jgi:hypothetical protein